MVAEVKAELAEAGEEAAMPPAPQSMIPEAI